MIKCRFFRGICHVTFQQFALWIALGVRMKTRWFTTVLWIVSSALAVLAIAYSFHRRGETQYWDGAIGNWLATLLGIISGVPVALFLERRRAKSELEEQRKRARRIRLDVLTLIRTELSDNAARLQVRSAMSDSVPLEPLKTSSWDAMRASGNLSHISEPALLGPISDAYRLLFVLADLEHHFKQVAYGVNVQFPDGDSAGTKLFRGLQGIQGPVFQALHSALLLVTSEMREPDSSKRADA